MIIHTIDGVGAIPIGAVQLCVDTDHCEQRRSDIASGRWV